jgi:CII-binding regulator of phage lambda lysogenization HflD
LNDFKKQKTELSNFTQSLVIYRKDYISIVDNEDKSKAIKDDTIKLYELSDQLKKLKTDYNSKQNETYLRDMVEIYVRDIKPLIERLQSVKYKNSYINPNELDNTSELIQRDYIYSDLFIPLNSQNNAKIITNKN